MPLKPEKYGIKLFMICEVDTGYCITAEVYSGKTDAPPGTKLFALVFRLLASGQLLDIGTHLYGDRLYSTPQLVSALLQRRVGYCGTLKDNQKGELYYI